MCNKLHSSKQLQCKGLHHMFATLVHYMYVDTGTTGEHIDIMPELHVAVAARHRQFTTWHCITPAGGRPCYTIYPAASWLCCQGRLGSSFMRSSGANKDNWMGISLSLLLEHTNCPLFGQKHFQTTDRWQHILCDCSGTQALAVLLNLSHLQ